MTYIRQSSAKASIYNIPAGWPFVDALAAGIRARAGDDPAELARVTVLLPTRRACRTLRDAFLRLGNGEALLLPRLSPIGDVDEDELLLGNELAASDAAFEVPPALPGLRRQLLLTRLVLVKHDGTPDQAIRLALELGRLLDEVYIERLSFDGLERLVPDDFSDHWQITLDFLKILTDEWPKILAEEGAIDYVDYRNQLLEAQARAWTETPPPGPVIAAGSTGSIPATADLLKTVAWLPEGAVVLPGFDAGANDDVWQNFGPHHPQFGMARLIEHIGVDRAEVALWPADGFADDDSRAHLINAALAPVDAMAAATEALDVAPAAFDGICRLDCPSPQDEAAVIALIMRQTLEQRGQTAALVTPDRSLARRVTAELRRWRIDIDDSAGTPLGQTQPGSFLRLTARMVVDAMAPVPLLAALKQPLASCGMVTAKFRRLVRALEISILRGPRPGAGLDGLRHALGEHADAFAGLLVALETATKEFTDLAGNGKARFADILAAHVRMAEALSTATTSDGSQLWAGEAGETLASFAAELLHASSTLQPLAVTHYPAILDTLLAGRSVRPRYGRHPRLNIWGLLEARLQKADVMVLGGLNEGVWPPEPTGGPWMSRPMMKAFGLPPPERRIGLAAHDFAQASSSPRVFLTRAKRIEGVPTVPSRWLKRLDHFLERLDMADALHATEPWLYWARQLDEPEAPRRVAPPHPTPPLATRPRRLSVTQVETWIRDPYAIYARFVLGLKPLEALDANPGAAERGTIVHAALDAFVSEHPDELPAEAERKLLAIGQRMFDAHLAQPSVRAFWWPRFNRIVRWFLDFEAERRRAGFKTACTEASGELNLVGPGGNFTLTAKADRIDRCDDGGLVIIDYKTAAPPSDTQVRVGFAPQLPLEAAIAEAGGFKDLEAEVVAGLMYIRLSGGRVAGKAHPVKLNGVTVTVADAVAGLKRLVCQYDNPEMPYLAQHRPKFINVYADYDHLARVWEWRVGWEHQR
ncbi:MAG: hypothetical protein CFH05_00103 [Alphaproteobacteria bacterium MarineAlpha3_Bin4]|nr:MAG: hypothetical protein CFH05_00103 [Alphaproteobacteria bacterium MarineAlpha3_Bin4]